MKRAVPAILVLLIALSVSVPALAVCYNCYSVDVPDPDRPGTFQTMLCLDLAVPSGYIVCQVRDNGRICFTEFLCFNDYDDPFPKL